MTTGSVLLAEARRYVWAVNADFWPSFTNVIRADRLPLDGLEAAGRLAAERRRPSRERASRNVAVVPLHGLITPRASLLSLMFGGDGLEAFASEFATAVADDDVSAILIDVDSPGGSTAMVEETAALIRAGREVKPVISAVNPDAGSAAYWLAAQADEITSTPSGMAGSVGCFVLHVDASGLNEKMGIEPTYISAGKFKTETNEDAPLTDEAAEHLQEVVDEAYGTFVSDLAKGRGVSERTVERDYGEGRMLSARKAEAAGMVDRVEPFAHTLGRLVDGEAPERGLRSAGGPVTIESDEANRDEDPLAGKSPAQVAREQDEELADSVIASH